MKSCLLAIHTVALTIIAIFSLSLEQASAQTTLISPTGDGGFENGANFAANGWSSDNGTATNKWFVGTVPPGFTNNSAFVSNDGGTTWSYTNTTTSVVHFWRDVTFPAGETNITLSFNWQALGETSSFDALMVSLAPTSYTPVATTTSLGTGVLAAPAVTIVQLWNVTSVQTANITIPGSLVGNCSAPVTLRLIFTWKNDGTAGTPPPSAIDNISLVSAGGGAPLAGTFSVGPAGVYPTITAAAADLAAKGASGPVIFELNAAYTSASETFPIVLGPYCNASSVNTATIRPAAGAPLLSVAGGNAGPTFDINSGNWWRIDGRPGGTGTTKGLVVSNSSTTGQAIRFINDGSNNIVRYCDVQGVNTSTTNGVILFSTTAFSNGNDNNLIDNCDVHDGATTPANCIFSSGTSTTANHFNSNNTVSNNNIFNHFGTGASIGIILTTGSTQWTVTGNSFYQTIPRVLAAAQFGAINCPLTISNNFVITNNFIGGSAPMCGGAPMTLTGSGNFRGMNFTVGPGTTLVQGNTIQNINLTTLNATFFNGGILLGQGNFLCTGNTVGSLTANNSIVLTMSGSAGGFSCISAGGTAPTNTSTISNNSIGGVSLTVSGAPATPPSVRGISVQGTTAGSNYIVTGNTVGSTTLANSITGDGNLAGSVIGVVSFSNALGQQITNNSIANLTASNAGTANVMWGILAQGTSNIGTFTITGNTLRDLTSGSGATGSGGAASIMGISILTTLSTGGSNNISQNTIHTLVNNNPTAAASLTGINNSVPSVTGNTLARNSIHSFNLLSTALTGIMTGLQLNAGTANVQNNMIRLGVDAAGADITNGYGIFGIREAAGNNNVHLNSVYIGGSGVSAGTTNTFAFSSVVATGARNYVSNVFYNARSNGAGTGKHYALEFGGTAPNPAGIASNYNDLYAPGTGGFIGLFNAADQATLAAWRTATGNDFQSVSGDPKFIAPNGTSSTVDLHIQAASATPVEGSGQPIPSATDDYDGSLRASLTPTDIGADAGNFVLADISGPGIGYTPLTGACGTGDMFLLGVNITDGTGVPTAGALRPRIYYRKGVGAYFSSPGTLTSGNGNNGSWNFTIAVADLGGVAAGDLISYYVIAQDNLGNIGSNAGGAVATDVNTVTIHPVTPNTVTVQASLSGAFTVGAGGNFTTLTAAVAAYNTSCLAGPVVFSLTDAMYAGETYPITINQVSGANAVNTLTIRPAAGVNASFTTSTTTALIKLNGADWVIIDGSNNGTNSRNLTFSNTNATASAVLWNASLGGGGNGATNNTLKNLIIIGGSGTVAGIYGIVSSSTAAIATGGEDNDNFRAENNAISKVYNGISNLGLATNNALLADGLVITQNLIGDANSPNYVTNRGIEVNGVNSPIISQNTIFNIITPSTATNAATGIDLGTNVVNGEVVRNNISTVYNPNTGGWNAYGIHFSSTVNLIGVLVANNFISDIKTVNYVVSSFNAFGIRFSGGLNLKVYNNNINMFGDVTAGTNTGSMSANIYISSSAVIGLDLRNNILSNTQNFALAGAFTYNVYLGTTGVGISIIDFNDYHGINTATTTRRVGWDGGGARTTLADWRTFTGQDVSSYSVAPVFVSNTDLHLAGNANHCLDGGGTPLASVPNDFDGQPRNATIPDIGADEFANPDLFLTVSETSGIANDGIVCSGTTVVITASGGGTYLWNTGATTAAISVVPTTNTTYTVTVTNGTCTDVLTTTITVLSAPSLSTAVTQPSTCVSTDGAINLTVTPAATYTYDWGDLPGTNDPEDRTNLIVGSYTVTVTNTVTGCTASLSVFLTGPGGCDVCPGIANVSVTPNPACVNATFTLTSTNLANMGNTYGIVFKSSPTALPDPYTGGTILATVPNSGLTNGGTTATATASINTVGAYFIYAVLTPTPTDPTCRPSATTNLTISALPVPAIAVTEASGTTANDGITCTGAPVTLTASGGTTFLWSTGATTAAITVSPTATTTYTVTVTNVTGCSAIATRTITVNSLPTTFTVTGGGSYCAGGPGLVVGLSGSQTGVNYQLRLNTANVGAPVAGTGSPINFPAQTGVGNYTVAATSTSTGCSTLMTGSVNIATFNCNVAISDPCICKNNATTLANGQFEEAIKVNAPNGQTWSVIAVNGLFQQGSPAPPAAPLPIALGTTLTPLGGNMYELRGVHVDAIGYSVTVVNQAGVALSIGNSCQYPNPAITSNLGADFCLYSDPVTLTGTPGDNNIVSQGFTVNGVPATQFDPGNGLGQYLIVYTVNGGTPKAAGVTDPGCTQSVQQYVNVVATPTLLVCDDLVYVSLDADCTEEILPDQVLEGSYFCYDDYKVELDKTAPYGNGPWVPAILEPNDVGKTYQARVTHLISGSTCWGNIKVEDKLPPILTCPPADVACNAAAVPGDISAFAGSNFTIPQFVVPTTAATVSGSTTVNIPAGTPVIGFTVHFQTTHTWIGDINATLTSPSGQTILLFDRPGVPATAFGCANNGMDVIFDDGATNTALQLENTCNATIPAISGTFQSIQSLSTLLSGNLNGTWTCTVQDFVAADGGNVTVTLQFQTLGPVPFPNGLVLNQTVFPNGTASYIVTSGAGTPVVENCSDVTLSYLDAEVPQDCPTGLTKIVNRKWTAKDASGNTSTCVQVINFHLPTLGDVTLPPSYDNFDADALPCGDQYPTPDYIEGLGLQGYPEVFGSSDGCTIGWTYNDDVIEVCDGTYKIFREWKIINWCTGDKVFPTQVIKVLDEEGPSISCPANLTVSTDPFSCCAVIDLPDVIISDNCSRINNIGGMFIAIDPGTLDTIGMFPINGTLTTFPGNNLWNPDTLASFGKTPCLPVGTHTVVYQAEDDCGNTSTCTFRLTVRDYVPPVAACTEFTVVSIGPDDPNDCYGPAGYQDLPPALGDCEGAGVTWVKAKTFDQGSYDNCNNVKFTVQRMAPYSDCINALNSINGSLPCNDEFPDFPNEFERAVAEQDSIKFYCCEVGTSQMVILRVYQLDAFGNFAIGPDGTPIQNSCMVEVEVQDKIKPVCITPGNVTVSCESFDPSLWAYGKPTVYDNCCLDTSLNYQGQCGLKHTVSYNLFDTVCNRGTINRTFQVFDCHGQSAQCTQRIIVTYEQDYWIRFPNDVVVTTCDGSQNYGEPVFNLDQDCELLGVSFEDQIFTVVPDACFKIERTWTIINWCTYNVNGSCVIVPNPNPNATVNHPTNLPGPTVSPLGTPAPWAPTNISIAPGQPQTNYSTFWDANANCYKYKQIIKIVDTQDPTVTNCPASPVEYCDSSPNDNLLWNQSYWWDGVSHDLCEGDAPLTITATDACSGANINITYLLFLDLDGDGTMETVINSNNTPAPGTVNFNNLGNPNYAGGTVRVFDGRPVLPNDIYRWANHQSVSGTSRTASVQWKTFAQMPTPANQLGQPGIAPQLPYGTHKIKWTITDGCGNENYCEYTFVVKDCKAPTVVCFNGLSVNIMPAGMIEIWASDFLQYGEDNCTPDDLLVYSIRKLGQGTGFPVDANGDPIPSVTFDCTELGPQEIELWAMDLAGNASFCQATIDVQDPFNNCTNNISVAGALKTEANEGLEDANVNLQSGTISLFDMTDQDGVYQFLDQVPSSANYTVTPTKDDNPLNGVSTYDLVLISKHILGLEPLQSPYKMIAADANKSNSITTFDIVEIRKLILGIYTELPNNTSWRFVDKSFAFPNQANPFQTQFPEIKSVAGATVDQMTEDFMAVKVGDVNGTAIPNSLLSSDDRSSGSLIFDVDDREVKVGEVFAVTFKADQRVQGWQFTLNLAGLEVADIVENDRVTKANFGVFADALTISVDGAEAKDFAVQFRATQSGLLSQMLGVSGRITRAEAYSLTTNRLEVALRFNGVGASTISGVGFELYQNQPNPFVNKTVIGFHLPVAAEATLTVHDETGRMLFTQKGRFAAGYNAIPVDRALLNTNGLLYYTLKTDTDTATKKMIQTK